jgi:putative DNA primase/helicase
MKRPSTPTAPSIGYGSIRADEILLDQLENVKKTASGWTARCPAHDDNRASLSVSIGDDGKTLIHCHAGCTAEQIVGKLGLTMRDLMPNSNDNGRKHGKHHAKETGEIVATYNYRDEKGVLLYQSVRMVPKHFFQRRPKQSGGWINELGDVRRVLYRLPELLAADPAATVYIVEGEKDVERLESLGLVATTNAGGACKWRQEYNEHLLNRHIVVLPDNDIIGRKHGQQVASALHGVAATVKIVELPGLPEKSDISDWLDAGGTIDQLQQLVDAAPEWTPAPSPTIRQTEDFPLTDTGLAERFALQHGDDVRYCHAWAKWLCWDGTRWKIDDGGAVDQLGKQTVRSILREAADEADDARRKALTAFAKSSESVARRTAMLTLARSEPPIPVSPDVLDTNPWILNCPNGRIDLRTGQPCEHRREDFITKLCQVEYQPAAPCPIWLNTLDKCFARTHDLIDFVQRFAGYCLTGDVSEQILSIWHGVGANGKSTILNALMEMLGPDYAMKATADLLLMKRDNAHPTALTDLHGKRLVACIETDEGRRLAEALVKELTGGDPIRARRMREDFWQFMPTHKVVLACNHRPTVRGTDLAIWRRLKLVPFNVVIPPAERDKHLPEKLRAELPGVLAWSVRGCLDWQQHGLGEPKAIVEATANYQNAEDVLLNFIGECCVVEPGARVKAADLLDFYKEWSGDRHITSRKLTGMLTERGVERYTNNGLWYRGIGLSANGTTEQRNDFSL